MISNSSPLIFLSRINQLTLLKKLFGNVLMPEEVKDEIMVGEKPGITAISEAIKEGWIKVIEVKNNPFLGIKGAENSAINLARQRKEILIIDNFVALRIAKNLGVKTARTTDLIVLATNKGIITKQEATSIIGNLIEVKYYIRPTHYMGIINKLK